MKSLVTVVIMGLILSSGLVYADTVVLNPVQDTWNGTKTAGDDTTNHGASTSLSAAGASSQKAIMQFDFSALAGATINSATLEIYVEAGGVSGYYGTYKVTNSWEEMQVTWYNRLTGTAWDTVGYDYNSLVRYGNKPLDSTTLGWQTISVSPDTPLSTLVQEWVDGTTANNGLMVARLAGLSNAWINFSSSEGTNPAKLTLDYTPAVPEPATVGMLICGGLVAIFRKRR